MRRFWVLIFLCGWGGAVMAEEQATYNRTMVQFGVMGTLGGAGDLSHSGWGISVRPYFYLDPSSPDGLYFGFLSGTFMHSADGINVADTRYLTLGWRGNPTAFFGNPVLDFQTDFSVSPTLGSRISGSSILGSSYTGVGFTVGLYLPILDWGDIGLSWEPTINLTTFGAPDIPEKSYSDFVVYWTMKSHNKTEKLPWK